jgi:4-hydroxy-tetrahydrodipicolinate reductase
MRIILSGCSGHMGLEVGSAAASRGDCEIAAGFDINTSAERPYPIFSEPSAFGGDADVLVDFSNAAFFDKVIAFACERSMPAVIATTGLDDAQKDLLNHAAQKIPVFFSANMSLGVSLLTQLAKKAAAVIGADSDIEIVEMHHNRKLDAPSGTALMLADAISSELPTQTEYVYDRHSVRRKRTKNEIGIHSLRGGNVVGEHEVIFACGNEIIKISHSALSRGIFAAGALNAAAFITKMQPGLYSMNDLVSSIGG